MAAHRVDEYWLESHARTPFHRANLDTATHTATRVNPVCSDCVTLQVRFDSNQIAEAWHTAQGCLVSQAAASVLCQWCEGQSVDELNAIEDADYLKLLGPLTPMRQQCALLAFHCLKQILDEAT